MRGGRLPLLLSLFATFLTPILTAIFAALLARRRSRRRWWRRLRLSRRRSRGCRRRRCLRACWRLRRWSGRWRRRLCARLWRCLHRWRRRRFRRGGRWWCWLLRRRRRSLTLCRRWCGLFGRLWCGLRRRRLCGRGGGRLLRLLLLVLRRGRRAHALRQQDRRVLRACGESLRGRGGQHQQRGAGQQKRVALHVGRCSGVTNRLMSTLRLKRAVRDGMSQRLSWLSVPALTLSASHCPVQNAARLVINESGIMAATRFPVLDGFANNPKGAV